MRRILIASPIRGEIPQKFHRALIDLKASPPPGVVLDTVQISGTSVNFARNEIVYYARQNAYDEIWWWDVDLNPTQEQKARMLSQTEDIVCAMYPRRLVETSWHITALPGVDTRADGLQQVFKCAIGFSKMKVSVFDRMAEKFPDRACGVVQKFGDKPLMMVEFFPMSLVGPNSPEGRLEAIRRYVEDDGGTDIELVKTLLTRRHETPSILTGEDYGFCRLAVAAGIKIHLDTTMIVKHSGQTEFPIDTEVLKAALAEGWRQP